MRRPKLVAMREEMYHKLVKGNQKIKNIAQVALILSIFNSLFLLVLFILKL